MRNDSITPGVKDVTKQVKDPQGPGSRGLKDQIERKLKGHTMRDLLNIVDGKQRQDESREQINELFDKPYPIKQWDQDGDDTQAQFDIEDGVKIIITWKRITIKAYELMFTMGRDNPKTGEYEVTFAQTNTGNAPRIFATVLAAHKEWLKKHNPEYLYFSAKKSEGGRVGLYAAMVKKLAGMFGYTTVPQDQIPPDVKQYMDRQGEVGHFLLKSKTAKPDQHTLPEIEYFRENRTNTPGTWQDIVQYMSYIAKSKIMAAGLTGDEIAKTLAAEGKTNLATELKGLSDRQKATGKAVLKSWNEYFDLIKNAYKKAEEKK